MPQLTFTPYASAFPRTLPRFGGPTRHGQGRDDSRTLFLEAQYNRNPFSVASDRLERKRSYQQECARYEKELTQSRPARLVGATINWSPWVVFLGGSKLIEKVAGAIPPSATLPGLIVFSIVTNPFLPDVQEKVMKAWKQPPEMLQRKSRLEALSQAVSQSPALLDLNRRLAASSGSRSVSWWGDRFSRAVDYDQVAHEMATALISRYKEPQDALRKVLPQLKGTEEARRFILPALNRLLDESPAGSLNEGSLHESENERISLLGARGATASWQGIVDDMVDFSTQENNLLHKTIDPTEERRRYSAHLRQAIPALIDYLDAPAAGRAFEA